jgi:hypothetical protein
VFALTLTLFLQVLGRYLIYAGSRELIRLSTAEMSYRERSPTLSFLKTDPRLDALTSDLRFDNHWRRLNLPVQISVTIPQVDDPSCPE